MLGVGINLRLYIEAYMTQPIQVSDKIIRIKAASKGNGLTTLLLGIVALFIGFSLLGVVPQQFILVAIGFIALGIIAGVIGFFKIKEPDYSVIFTEDGIHYQHRHGNWVIAWNNLQRVDAPRVTRGVEQVDLSMVGFKIKDYAPFLANISQRLMTNTLMEQRPLLMQNMEANCNTGQCAGSDLIEDQKFKLPDGKLLTGVQGMFANRMNKLRDRLGYDVYINEAELDRTAGEFVALVKALQEDVNLPT